MSPEQSNYGPGAALRPFDAMLPEVSFAWTRPDSTYMAGMEGQREERVGEYRLLVEQWLDCFEKCPDLRNGHDRAVALVARTGPATEEGHQRVLSALYVGIAGRVYEIEVASRARLFEHSLDAQLVQPLFRDYETALAHPGFHPTVFLKQIEQTKNQIAALAGYEMQQYGAVISDVIGTVLDLNPVITEKNATNLILSMAHAWCNPYQVAISKCSNAAVNELNELTKMVRVDAGYRRY